MALAAQEQTPSPRRCYGCGEALPITGVVYQGSARYCGVICLKARRRLLQADTLLNSTYACLPFDRFRRQSLFHQIDLSFPGLQLVHERPYIFIVNHFLSAAECSLLIAKASAGSMQQQLVGESDSDACRFRAIQMLG